MNKHNIFKRLIKSLVVILLMQQVAGAKQPALNREEVSQLIQQSIDVMQEHYIEPQIVPDLRQMVLDRLRLGHYDDLQSTAAFADAFGRDLRALTGDSHLSLYTIEPEEKVTHILSHPEGKLTYNYSFETVQYLAGNIGYLKFNKFHPDERTRQTVDATFNFLKNSQGMIIDLRDTIGGSPWLAQYILSYFLPSETKLWETLDSANKVLNTMTVEDKPAHNAFLIDYPVWILTSHDTASASELFAGVMQANHKAELVGGVTAGAGFYVGVRRITDDMVFRISLSKPMISANQFNWEKIGLTPDHEVPALDALDLARQLSLKKPIKDQK